MRYRKAKNKREWEGFRSPAHMVQVVARSHKDDPHWKGMTRVAQDWLDERSVPKTKVRRNDLLKIVNYTPHRVAHTLMHDFRRARRGKHKGAGLWDAISSLAAEARHLIGLDAFLDSVGLGYEHIPLSVHEIEAANAVSAAYKSIAERPDRVGSLKTMPEYDTDGLAVFQQEDGELLVAVRGTKMNSSDLFEDLQILGGGEIRSTELQTLLQDLDNSGLKYDIAGHSLGTQYIQNAITDGEGSNADEIFLFNPASSPFQSDEYLTEQANSDKYTYFINQGDLVSKGIWQKMDSDTLASDRVHIGPYRWDPLHCHFLDQWGVIEEKSEEETEKEKEDAEKEEKEAEDAAGEQKEGEARGSGWTVNFNK